MKEKIYKLDFENYMHSDVELGIKASITMKLLTASSALYIGKPDGEDSTGRAKFKQATPKEVVAYAVEMTEELCRTFEEKGWFLENPLPTKVKKHVDYRHDY